MKTTIEELDTSLETDNLSVQIKIIEAAIEVWENQLFISKGTETGLDEDFAREKLAEEQEKLDIHKINNPEYFI